MKTSPATYGHLEGTWRDGSRKAKASNMYFDLLMHSILHISKEQFRAIHCHRRPEIWMSLTTNWTLNAEPI